MFNTKKVRKSGSVNIPIAMRRDMNLQPNDALDVQLQNGKIIMTPAAPRCQFCSSQFGIVELQGKHICRACAEAAYYKIKGDKNNE